MKVVGYTDRLSARAGESISFMVSCASSGYEAEIIRLRHGDSNPAGPGFKADTVETHVAGRYPGRVQRIHTGSYIAVPAHSALRGDHVMGLQAWICPTLPGKGLQAILSHWSPSGGYGLFLSESGELELRLASASYEAVVQSGAPLRKGCWYYVAATWDVGDGRAAVYQLPVIEWPEDRTRRIVHRQLDLPELAGGEAPVLIAAMSRDGNPAPERTSAHFNGKIDRPCLFRGSDPVDEQLGIGLAPATSGIEIVAMWDFSRDIAGTTIHDAGPHGLHGWAVNLPTRAVTGYNWSGRESDFRNAPEEYGAIHFHDDDLEDARWEVDFRLAIPKDLPSGVYAAKLTSGDDFDYVPFFVRPAEGGKTAKALFLAPTFTYMAYGNEHLPSRDDRREASLKMSLDELLSLGSRYEQSIFRYMLDNNLHSSYELHSDGSPVHYVSRLRPMVNFRPLYNKPLFRFKAPHVFNEDLYLVDWLCEKEIGFDCATDEDLNREGSDLLDGYRVVLTGSHPEYWTDSMLSCLDRYLRSGGRLMYLGGNGFYWVTSVDPNRPHIVEIRRSQGMRTNEAAPGELHHSTTGELGGLWRQRGRAPQRMLGIGTISAGSEPARPYRRLPGSADPKAAFIFDGIGDQTILGDFGLHLGGAAGWELDCIDESLGTPAHTIVLASSFNHSDDYQIAVEELRESSPSAGGRRCPAIRADLTYLKYPNGGAVFSVGSISYLGSLSNNNYDNNISKVTENVLKAFQAEKLTDD